MSFQIRIFDTVFDFDKAAAEWVAARLGGAHPVLGLATGETPVGMYEELVRMYHAKQVRFKKARAFNLDEYVGLCSEHEHSFSAYMRRHLFDRVDISEERIHIPEGGSADPAAEAEHYDALLNRFGPIDAQVLGIGANGHIGFNEPKTPFDRGTHVVELTEETRRANARSFGSLEAVPERAITMGVANILATREILLLARGGAKADAVRRALEEKPTPEVPASALQSHPRVTVFLDRAAAGSLK